MKKILLGVSCAALSVSLMVPVFAAAPVKISTVAPTADLVAEIEARIKSLEEALASNDSYLQAKGTTIPTEAGVLSVLAQGVADAEDKAGYNGSAPDVRDAAISIAKSKTYDDAKKGLAAAKDAHGGKKGSAKADHEWNKLSGLGAMMKDVNKRNGKLRRVVRKLPDDTSEAARDASVLALLAVATHEDTHEVKNKADVPKWQAMSKEMQTQMTALSAALKKKDAAAAGDAFKKANTACSDCHAKFRDE